MSLNHTIYSTWYTYCQVPSNTEIFNYLIIFIKVHVFMGGRRGHFSKVECICCAVSFSKY